MFASVFHTKIDAYRYNIGASPPLPFMIELTSKQ